MIQLSSITSAPWDLRAAKRHVKTFLGSKVGSKIWFMQPLAFIACLGFCTFRCDVSAYARGGGGACGAVLLDLRLGIFIEGRCATRILYSVYMYIIIWAHSLCRRTIESRRHPFLRWCSCLLPPRLFLLLHTALLDYIWVPVCWFLWWRRLACLNRECRYWKLSMYADTKRTESSE